MDSLLVAHLVNVIGGGIVMLFSLLVGGRHVMPFIRPWSVSFGLVLIFLCFEAAAHLLGRHAPMLAVQALFMPLAGWFAIKTLRLLEGREPAPGRTEAAFAAAAAAGVGLALAGCRFEVVLMASFLAVGVPVGRLGVYFLRRRRGETSAVFLGVSMLILALWPVIYPYPLLVNTPWAWIGYSGSGVLHAVIGLAMIAFLVDESWRRYREEHEKLNRLRSQLVSVVSHELRTPITTVIGYAEFLADGIGGPLTDEQREYVTQIQNGGGRLRRLVDDLLHFSLEEGQTLRLNLQPVDFAARTRAAAEGLRPHARQAGVTLDINLPASPLVLRGDPVRLEQVVTNLLTNAIKFTPEGGTVTLLAGVEGEEAWLTVADTGIGIPASELPHVFDMYYQGDRSSQRARGGSGLGLAIARAIAEAHGGSLTCESAPDAGTTFRLTLPLASSAASSPALEPV